MMNSITKSVKIGITLKIEAFFFLIKRISLPVLLFTAMLFQVSAAAEPRDSFIHFKDGVLEAAVREKLKTTGEITAEDMARLTDLKIETGVVRDLTGLEYALNLQSLIINNTSMIRDLSPLRGLKNLHTLVLGVGGIVGTHPNELKELLKNLPPDANLVNNPCGMIQDISPLKDLTNMKILKLNGNLIEDISPLRRMTNLQELYLSNNLISDISPVEGMKNLQRLDLSVNRIKDISPIKGLTRLKSLALHINQIEDVSSIANLTELEELNINDNNIKDVSSLSGLGKLNYLDLSQNQIRDISPISNLLRLKVLHLRSNEIKDISTVSRLKNLQYLSLGQNYIEDISPLAKLTGIVSVDLFNNRIKDISPLIKAVPGPGGSVNLWENPIDIDKSKKYLDILQKRGISVDYDRQGETFKGRSTRTSPAIVINGAQVNLDVKPVIEKGRILVPIRAVFERLGAEVKWDGQTRMVTVKKDENTVILELNKKSAMKNDTEIPLDVPARMVKGRVLIPVRFVSEALGAKVDWRPDAGIVDIKDICLGVWNKGPGVLTYVGRQAPFDVELYHLSSGVWPEKFDAGQDVILNLTLRYNDDLTDSQGKEPETLDIIEYSPVITIY
ncbi:hypothetical protein DXT63_17480, partial [Thermoanaerobacteraceae bacterium SP2]